MDRQEKWTIQKINNSFFGENITRRKLKRKTAFDRLICDIQAHYVNIYYGMCNGDCWYEISEDDVNEKYGVKISTIRKQANAEGFKTRYNGYWLTIGN